MFARPSLISSLSARITTLADRTVTEPTSSPKLTRTAFFAPLVCAALAILCLLLVPSLPNPERPVITVLSAVLGLAVCILSWRQGSSDRSRGLIRIGSIPHEQTMQPAFGIPYAERLLVSHLVRALVIAGMAGNLLLTVRWFPDHLRGPLFAVMYVALIFAPLLTAAVLPYLLRRSASLALQPGGIVSNMIQDQCVIPWEQIERIAVVRLKYGPIPGSLCIGFALIRTACSRQ